MTVTELYQQILSGFQKIPGAEELLETEVVVTFSEEPEKTLIPEGDPPSTVSRPEHCVTASLSGGGCGQAYTEKPSAFQGTLKEALEIPPSEREGISAVTMAALNAAMDRLSLCQGIFPEEDEAKSAYADALCRYITEQYGKEKKIILVGYDGYIVKRFMDEGLEFWTMDRDPGNIAQNRFHHVVVNNAKRNRESSFVWGELFVITGSTLCNGTITHYLGSGKELLFYGITCAGAATILKLPWFDPKGEKKEKNI